MLLRCGVTDVFCEQHGKTKEVTLERIGTDLHLRSGIMKRKDRYFDYIVRRDGGIEKQILQGAVEGKRGKGRASFLYSSLSLTCVYLHVLL